jgi:hypothetical protein
LKSIGFSAPNQPCGRGKHTNCSRKRDILGGRDVHWVKRKTNELCNQHDYTTKKTSQTIERLYPLPLSIQKHITASFMKLEQK